MAPVLPATETSHNLGSMPSYVLPEIFKDDLQCIRKLGEGGFGEVFKAKHVVWDVVLAVKVCKQSVSGDANTSKETRSEIKRMLKTAIHDHLIVIRGIVNEPDACCIVMEYMEHGSLSSFRNKLQKFPNAVKVEMIYGITRGMTFLHSQKEPIIHRDLKLDNILVNKRLDVKICDFGLATYCGASNYGKGGGTITHIPPEHLEDMIEPTTKFDVYSFGISLWQFASGCEPYKNCNGIALLEFHVKKGTRPKIERIPEDEPVIFKELIEESWQQDPARRPEFKDINKKVMEEFVSKYKQDVEAGRIAILQELASKQDFQDESGEHDIFPWQRNPRPVAPMTDTDARSRVFDMPTLAPADNDPLSLRSMDVNNTQYPVPVSDTEAEGKMDGVSCIEEKLTNLTVNAPKYGVPDATPHEQTTTPHEQATPTCCHGSVPNESLNEAATGQFDYRNRNDTSAVQPQSSVEFGSDQKSYSDSNSPSTSQYLPNPQSVRPEPTYNNASNEPVTERIISDIADYIGNQYKALGHKLHLPAAKIEVICDDNHNNGHEVAFQIMLKWRQSQGKAATKWVLAEALNKIGLKSVAEKFLI